MEDIGLFSGLLEKLINQFNGYFYWEYTVTVWVVISAIRFLCTPKEGEVAPIPATPFTNIDRFIHPKWLVFGVSIIVGLATKALKVYGDEPFVFFKAMCSVGMATMGYDWLGKPIVDKFIKGRNPFAAKTSR